MPPPASKTQKLYLRVSRAQMDEARGLLEAFPGDVPVYFHIAEEGITLLATRTFFVNASADCVKALSEMLGEDNIKLVDKK
jgi:hypothetical protein